MAQRIATAAKGTSTSVKNAMPCLRRWRISSVTRHGMRIRVLTQMKAQIDQVQICKTVQNVLNTFYQNYISVTLLQEEPAILKISSTTVSYYCSCSLILVIFFKIIHCIFLCLLESKYVFLLRGGVSLTFQNYLILYKCIMYYVFIVILIALIF